MKIAKNRTVLVVGIAVLLGVGASVIAISYLNQRVADIEARGRGEMRSVVVALQDLKKGERVTNRTVGVRKVPVEWTHSGAITPEQFARADNAVLAYPAMKGEPVVWAQLENARDAAFSTRLASGRRAVTVPVDEISSVSGMVEPNDRIDIVVSINRDNRNYTFTLLQGVTVLATGSQISPGEKEPDGRARTFTTITLDTTPEDAKRVIAAREIGRVTALLRAPNDTGNVSSARSDAHSLLGLVTGVISSESSVPVIYGGGPIKLTQRFNPRAELDESMAPAKKEQ